MRFWNDSGFDPKAAKKSLESDAAWRDKMGINTILQVRVALHSTGFDSCTRMPAS